ncbi:MAG TPA: alpha/beta fold hydrolase [Candidatus Dormibacteraeota bacterium]|nr:alpha/beta fold hydrolase [Candidatus Dormibacteraeota bacterium]
MTEVSTSPAQNTASQNTSVRSSAAAFTEMLTGIWQRQLRHAPISPEDNFFDLGGDSSIAVEVFNEIAKSCGKELPPVTIYHAPTIAALASLLEEKASPRLPSVVQLKAAAAGDVHKPVFIAHGLGGSAMEFFQVVKYVDVPNAIYGLQARGTDGVDEPLDTIESMAQFHIEAIRAVQPAGPYFLVGYSLGGLVTLEMARRLMGDGEKVGLLALLESYPARRYVPAEQRVRLALRLTRQHLSNMAGLPIRDAISYFLRPSERMSHFSRSQNGKLYRHPPTGVWSTAAMQRVRDSGYLALQRYRPSYFHGKISFVAAKISSDFPDDPVAVWRRLVDRLTVEVIPGDHFGIITDHFDRLGELLTRYLREVT